jgi:thioredoxin 1
MRSIEFYLIICITALLSITAQAGETREIPVKNMVTMVDLGSDQCIPCKLMTPILEKLEHEYKGKAAIIFIDVTKDMDIAREYGVTVIPTQIFFEKGGKESSRHAGFLDEKKIKKRLDMLLSM